MKKGDHLPVFGIGPILVLPILLISLISLILSCYQIIPICKINELHEPLMIMGIALITAGIIIWISAVTKSKITQEILDSNLVTTGIYAHIMHPIYSAFLLASTGLIVLSQNILLFVLPIIYWTILSLAMIRTEEKWLLDKFGQEYEEYAKRTNRFIPRLKRK